MPDRPLRDKTALVTGGSRGIGRAIAERLAGDGCAVVAITYNRDAEAAADACAAIDAAGAEAVPLQAALEDPAAIEDLFVRLDAELSRRRGDRGLDIVVNNAGNRGTETLATATPASFDTTFGVHGRAPFFVAQQAVERLRDGGRVVNISSGAARRPSPRIPVYAMSKAATNAFTHALAVELAPRGITVNVVAPGHTETDLSIPMREDPEFVARAMAETPMGRFGTPADIAPVVAFLCSPEAGWVTGQYIGVNGGLGL